MFVYEQKQYLDDSFDSDMTGLDITESEMEIEEARSSACSLNCIKIN